VIEWQNIKRSVIAERSHVTFQCTNRANLILGGQPRQTVQVSSIESIVHSGKGSVPTLPSKADTSRHKVLEFISTAEISLFTNR
jgi:hypothetical protein